MPSSQRLTCRRRCGWVCPAESFAASSMTTKRTRSSTSWFASAKVALPSRLTGHWITSLHCGWLSAPSKGCSLEVMTTFRASRGAGAGSCRHEGWVAWSRPQIHLLGPNAMCTQKLSTLNATSRPGLVRNSPRETIRHLVWRCGCNAGLWRATSVAERLANRTRCHGKAWRWGKALRPSPLRRAPFIHIQHCEQLREPAA